MGAVHHGDENTLVSVQRVQEGGPLRSDLLVLERAGQEDGHLYVRGPRGRRARVEQRGRTTEVRADERLEALGLQMELLVGQAGLVAGGDLGRRPRLPPAGCRAGVCCALGHPAGGEAVVVDPAGIPGGVEVVGRAERRNGRQVRRVGSRHHQLGETRVGDPDHPHLVVEHPGLCADRLHHVVAVVVRRETEEVERTAGTSGAAHLHADRGEAEQGCHDRADNGRGVGQQGIARRGVTLQRVNEAVRPCHVVAGVLDHGGKRTVGQRLAGREAHGGGQQDAVAHAHVVESGVELLSGVERRGRCRRRGQHRKGGRAASARVRTLREAVAGSRCQAADDEAAESVDHPGSHLGPAGVQDGQSGAGWDTGHVGLPDRPVTVEGQGGRGRARHCHGRQRARRVQQDHSRQEGKPPQGGNGSRPLVGVGGSGGGDGSQTAGQASDASSDRNRG